jgi:protein involved in polysaccharide export with SLBB domain
MISGAVRFPGRYVRNENMSLADLVVLAGGLKEEATTKGWEVSRIDTTQLGTYSRVFKIDMPREYWNDNGDGRFLLQDSDYVFVPSDPRYASQKMVQVTGYVMYPGTYAIRYEGERLTEVLKRAGGFKKEAYVEGSHFVRKAENAGWIPIDFKNALEDPESRDNVVLKDGDSVHVPYLEDVVYVKGEVTVPSPVLYEKGGSLKYYIRQAGGFKDEADEGRVVVFLPGGKKWEPGWFIFADPEILPGSSILVPKRIEKEDKTLPVIRDMAVTLASLAAIIIGIIQITK